MTLTLMQGWFANGMPAQERHTSATAGVLSLCKRTLAMPFAGRSGLTDSRGSVFAKKRGLMLRQLTFNIPDHSEPGYSLMVIFAFASH